MFRMLPVASLAITLAACSSIDARTNFDPDVDFARYSSFAMAPLPDKGPAHMPRYTRKAAERIQASIAEQMVKRGFAQVDGPQADLVVSFTVDTRTKSSDQVTEFGATGGLAGSTSETGDIWYDTGWNDGVQIQNYVEGKLLIDIFDPDLEKVVWHGDATADIFSATNSDRKARKAIRALLKRFPPE